MAWPAPGLVRGWPAPRVLGWAIGAWGRVVSIPPGWAAGWRSGSTGCSRTTLRTTGGSPGRSPPAAPAAGRPDRPPPALLRPVGRSARAIPGSLPRLGPPPRGGATPSPALPWPPWPLCPRWPRSAAAWRRSPAAHPGPARQAPRCPDPGVPASDPLPALFRCPPPRALLSLATPRLTARAALGPLPTGRRPGPMTPPSLCSAGNARPPPPGLHRWRRSFRRRPPLPRAGPCPAPPGAVKRLLHQSGNASPLPPCPFLRFCTSA